MSGFEAGDLVGRFRLERRLGEGGMGTVWVAVQEGLGRRVALKLLHPVYASNPNIAGRFRREAELAASLGHPNIVQVTDFGVHDGRPFLVMDLLEGESLAGRLAQGVLTPEEASFIGAQMLAALEVAHARDVKPDNIFLTSLSGVRDIVKLLDFGIARLVDPLGDGKMTSTGQVLGTPAYMSPEQARGQSVDQRSDLYAVGVVLYEALCGRTPFVGENYHQLMFAIVDEPPPPLASLRADLPPSLVAVIERALEKDPAKRFATAAAMREALQDAAPTRVAGHTPAPPLGHKPSPSSAPVAFAATLATPQPLAGVAQEPSPSLPENGRSGLPASPGSSGRRVVGLMVGGALVALGALGVWAAGREDPSSTLPVSIVEVVDASSDVHAPLDAGHDAGQADVGHDVGHDAGAARVALAPEPERAAHSPAAPAKRPPREQSPYRMVPCGSDGAPHELWNVRRGMQVRVASMTTNNVVRLDDLRPLLQSDGASTRFGECYAGHAVLDGQMFRMDIDAAGRVGNVSFATFCPVPPEVKSCITQYVRSLDFASILVTPGEISAGLSRPR